MMIYIALCDDEMSDLLEAKADIICALNEIQGEIKGGIDWEIDMYSCAKDMLNSEKRYNIVFLDVEMEGMDGIKTAEALHRENPDTLICFVTHHEDYMDEALDNHAFRFWTKPMNEVKLLYGMRTAVKRIGEHIKNITVVSSKQNINIQLEGIVYIYHNARLTHIVTINGEIKSYDTFKSVIEQLPKEYFAETHASCYVNLNYVTDYSKTEVRCTYNGKVYKPYISKRKYTAFDEKFKEWSRNLR